MKWGGEVDKFDYQKEANFINSVSIYIKKYGNTEFFKPIPPKSQDLLIPSTVHLLDTYYDLNRYYKDVKNSIKKYYKLYNLFKDKIKYVDVLIHRYDIWGMLSNISLSVSFKQKLKWGITHELFGSFYNVNLNTTYGSLFPDLEPNSTGNVLFFNPTKGQVILANPPYTSSWIRWMIRKILDEWLNIAVFHIIIPLWDSASRKKYNLKEYTDIPEITELIKKSKEHKIIQNFEFFDGIYNKKSILKDPIHYMMI